MAKIADVARALADEIHALPVDERVVALNEVRTILHEASPFADPVDLVLWVPAEAVQANDYNPNKVAEQEMNLLIDSIREDGYTQPIVSVHGEQVYVVVDGFHRNRVGKEVEDIRERIHGYLPVTLLNKPVDHRMASTVRHNRARGKHQVDLISELVKKLIQQGWPDDKIAQHLGMTEEELVRLKQVVGIAKMFATPEYSKSWGELDDGC